MSRSLSPETRYLNIDQVAKRYGVSTDSIWRWKRHGDFPKGFKVGPGTTRWRIEDIEAHEGSLKACFAVSFEPAA